MCEICADITNVAEKINLFSDEETDRIIHDIFSGNINMRNLSTDVYDKVAVKLTEGVYKGFGGTIHDFNYNDPYYTMIKDLRLNTYMFSAAKDYQMTRDINALLTKENGFNSFAEFKKQAVPVFDKYNKNYLSAEYNAAIASAQMANKWIGIEAEKETFPLLKYQTAHDGRVRPQHAILDGIIKPVNSPFWDKFYPPNGWNCRCDVIQLEEGEISKTPKGINKEDFPEVFRFNPGKQRIIYSPEHPYFNIADKDITFAKENFGLALPY